jgi:hypothetical protein
MVSSGLLRRENLKSYKLTLFAKYSRDSMMKLKQLKISV